MEKTEKLEFLKGFIDQIIVILNLYSYALDQKLKEFETSSEVITYTTSFSPI